MRTVRCLDCGMQVPRDLRLCPKCDNRLDEQTDGSTLTIDIAHHGERVADALAKLDQALADARQETAASLRIIVGSGLIRESVYHRLASTQRAGSIKAFGEAPGNSGAIVVRLKG